MDKQKNQEEVQIASPLPVILSGLVNGGILCFVVYLVYNNQNEAAYSKLPLLNFGFLLSTIVVAQIFFRRSIRTQITFLKLLMSGWAAGLIFASVVAIFSNWYLPKMGMPTVHFSNIIFSYSSIGLVISAIVAFFISRK